MAAARGVTLVELLVVLALLSLMAGFVGLAWRDYRRPPAEPGAIAAARRRAAEIGTAIPFEIERGDSTVALLALPDGRLVGPAGPDVDPLANHD